MIYFSSRLVVSAREAEYDYHPPAGLFTRLARDVYVVMLILVVFVDSGDERLPLPASDIIEHKKSTTPLIHHSRGLGMLHARREMEEKDFLCCFFWNHPANNGYGGDLSLFESLHFYHLKKGDDLVCDGREV